MGICVSASACVNGTTTTSGVAPRLPRPPSSPSNGGGSRGGAFTPVAASVSAFAASVYSRAESSGSLHRTTGGASHDVVQDSGLAYPSLLGRSGALATGPTSEHYRGSSSYGGSRGTFPAEQSADACLSRVSPHDAVHPPHSSLLLERSTHLRVGQSSNPFYPHSAEDQLPTTFDTLQETNDFARIVMRAAAGGGDVSSLSNLNDSAEHNLQYHLADSVLPPKAARDGSTPAAHNGAPPPAFRSNPLMPVAMSLAAIKPLTTASTFSSHSTPPLSVNGRAALKGAFVPLAPTPVNHSSQLRQPLRSPATVLDACHEPQFLFASVATLDGGGALLSLVPTAELTTGMHSSSQDDEEGEDETTTNASATNTTTTATQADPPLLNASAEFFGATASSTWASQYRSIDIGSTMALVQRSLSCEV